jgi:hypothetical protein
MTTQSPDSSVQLIVKISGVAFPLMYVSLEEMRHMQSLYGCRVGVPKYWTEEDGRWRFYPQAGDNLTIEVQSTE